MAARHALIQATGNKGFVRKNTATQMPATTAQLSNDAAIAKNQWEKRYMRCRQRSVE